MEEAIVKYYRMLAKNGYKYAGILEDASIIIKDDLGQRIRVCSSLGSYIRIYIKVDGDRITDIKYRCTCDPSTHVAVEILCKLIDGKTLDEALAINTESFFKELGTASEELSVKAKNLLALLNIEIQHYRGQKSPE